MKKVVIAILLIVSIFLMAGCGGNGISDNVKMSSVRDLTKRITKTNNNFYNNSFEYSQPDHEERFRDTGRKCFVYNSSGVALWICGAQFTDAVGDNLTYKKARGKFALVSIGVMNCRQDAITVDGGCFNLIDMEERIQYSPSAEGQLAFDLCHDNSSRFVQLNPGLQMSMWVVFDVPQDLLSKKIGVLGRGGFTGRKVLMDFGELKFKRMK